MSENTDLVAYEEQLKRELAGLRDQVEAPGSNRISVKGKLFTTPDGKRHPGPMRVVVLDFIAINQWWSGVYNANVRAPADCFAMNRELKALAPPRKDPAHPEIVPPPKPQAASCEGCPKNQWNTAPNGKGKACKNQRRLLIAPAPDPERPYTLASLEAMTIQVSPTGVKFWDKFVRDLASDHGMLPVQVITQISFEPSVEYPSLRFELLGKHGHLQTAMQLRAKYAELLLHAPEQQADAA